MVAISPKKLTGNWVAGYALDVHTISSTLLGYDEYGHEQFDTKRSEMGELLYRLKYRLDESTVRVITETVVEFIREQKWAIDLVVPVPPSNVSRPFQPVAVLSKAIANGLGVECCLDCVVKVKDTPELKRVFDLDKRRVLLEDAYTVASQKLSGKKVLVFDDLYRSGATLSSVSKALTEKGRVHSIYALTLTMTRSVR